MLVTCAAFGLGTGGPALAADGGPPSLGAPLVPTVPPVPQPETPLPETPLPDAPPGVIADPLAGVPPSPAAVPKPPSAPTIPPPLYGAGSDDPAPDPQGEADPGPDPTPDPAPEQPAVSTEAQTDGDNVNASIRVESPGENALVSQQSAPPEVVSPPSEPDISGQEPSSDPTVGAVDAPAPDPAASGATDPSGSVSQTGSTNTNVAVRVASPGDNGAVNQTTAGESAAPFEQYQDENSQYQSEGNTEPDSATGSDIAPWIWNWELSLCDGTTASTTTESGDSASRDWEWNWVWNWSCDPSHSNVNTTAPAADGSSSNTADEDRGSGGPHTGPANVNVSIRVLSPGDDGPVTQTSAASPNTGSSSTGSSNTEAVERAFGRSRAALDLGLDVHLVRSDDRDLDARR